MKIFIILLLSVFIVTYSFAIDSVPMKNDKNGVPRIVSHYCDNNVDEQLYYFYDHDNGRIFWKGYNIIIVNHNKNSVILRSIIIQGENIQVNGKIDFIYQKNGELPLHYNFILKPNIEYDYIISVKDIHRIASCKVKCLFEDIKFDRGE
jgi:hypothetical protein